MGDNEFTMQARRGMELGGGEMLFPKTRLPPEAQGWRRASESPLFACPAIRLPTPRHSQHRDTSPPRACESQRCAVASGARVDPVDVLPVCVAVAGLSVLLGYARRRAITPALPCLLRPAS